MPSSRGGGGSRARRPAAASTSCGRPGRRRRRDGDGARRRARLDARDVPVARPPRRLAFGRGPLPPGSELELRTGALADELAALAAEGVQSLLLEGGPTLATSFLADDLVDRLLVVVAPVLAGGGPPMLGELPTSIELGPLDVERLDDDLLLDARLRES